MAKKAKNNDATFYESIGNYKFSIKIRRKIKVFCEAPIEELYKIARNYNISDYSEIQKELLVHEILCKTDKLYKLEFFREKLVENIRANFGVIDSENDAVKNLIIEILNIVNEMFCDLDKLKKTIDCFKNKNKIK